MESQLCSYLTYKEVLTLGKYLQMSCWIFLLFENLFLRGYDLSSHIKKISRS